MNLFRHAKDASLDLQFLRICAVYKLMKHGVVTKDRAVELLEQRHVAKARQTVECWHFRADRAD